MPGARPLRSGKGPAAKVKSGKISGASTGQTGRQARTTEKLQVATVTMQARVDADFARELIESDAKVLGLSGASELVREGLRLVHKQAREAAMAAEYDKFYGGEAAPLPEGVAAIWGD